MQKRNTKQRRQDIVSLVNRAGTTVAVDTIAEHFDISEVTVRKDLAILAEQNQLVRQFGGAAPIGKPTLLAEQTNACKTAIARQAAGLVRNQDRIILDSGNTVAEMVAFLTQQKLVVMTNSLRTAAVLTEAKNEPAVLMTGGTWDAHSHSFQGKMAEQVIQAYSFDTAFIGASGLDVERGTTTFNELTGLSQTMAESAEKVVILAESEKFAYRMPNLELAWRDIHTLITDDGISDEIKQNIEALGVNIIVARANGE